ncbi:MAG: hypothetical protein AAFP13_13700 [Pseudomonadota bacterium]
MLAALPDWFGDPGAVDRYAAFAESEEATVLAARGDDETLGMVTLRVHAATQCQVHSLGVFARSQARRGPGPRRGRRCSGAGASSAYLGVKALAETAPDPNHAGTRASDSAMGFRPYERLDTPWGPCSPCLLTLRPL